MPIESEELVGYVANLIAVAQADRSMSPKERAAIEDVCAAIKAKKATLTAATKLVESGGYALKSVGTFATQVSNVDDMLFVCFADGDLNEAEKNLLLDFLRTAGLTREQLNRMTEEAIARARRASLTTTCRDCAAQAPADAKFCPKCGRPLVNEVAEAIAATFEIPITGYSIEFAESTAAGFPGAVGFARTAPVFLEAIRAKKTWYLANWPDTAFAEVTRLSGLLRGMRNRKAYKEGVELAWDELFGFSWCAEQRDRAYRPVEYCFGRDENRLNSWGCRQAQMDWTDWAGWFTYGRFELPTLVGGRHIWLLDKARIRHELQSNLHKVRFCPHLRPALVEAVLKALPSQVDLTANKQWDYHRALEESPGCLKIVDVEEGDGFSFRSEYFANGIRPRGLEALAEILRLALHEAGVHEVSAEALTK